MKVTASEVLAVSTECCSSSWRDCGGTAVSVGAPRGRWACRPGGLPSPHLGDLGVELGHVGAEHLPKLAEHLLVPGVVLQVHLGLDLQGSSVHTAASLRADAASRLPFRKLVGLTLP